MHVLHASLQCVHDPFTIVYNRRIERHDIIHSTQIRLQQRRTFLGPIRRGMGAVALAALLNPRCSAPPQGVSSASARDAKPQKWPGVVRPLHFPQKAKRVIWLCMAGGPSHLETFDFKPKLARNERQADAGSLHQGPADRAASGPEA